MWVNEESRDYFGGSLWRAATNPQIYIHRVEPDLAIFSHVNIKTDFVFLLSWCLAAVDGFYQNLSYRDK